MKRSISGFLAALLVCTALFTGAVAADKTMTVTLRVEGMSENKFYKKDASITLSGDKITVSEAVKQLLGEKNYVETAGQFGVYFSEIYGEKEFSATPYSGWNYIVDGVSPPVSASVYELKGGESIVFYFGDMNTLVPMVSTVYHGADGAGLKVSAMSWDANWAPVRVPVAEVELVWDGVSIGKTDKNGLIALTKEQAKAGDHKLNMKKDGEVVDFMGAQKAIPAVVRTAADNTFTIAGDFLFSDVASDHWAADFVYKLVAKGTVGGNGDGTFAPEAKVTGFQLSKMLGNLENAETNEAITRQQAAVLLYNHGKSALTELSDAKYADDSKITEQTAVYALTQAGIFSGDGEGVKSFRPNDLLRRDECAKLVVKLLESMGK